MKSEPEKAKLLPDRAHDYGTADSQDGDPEAEPQHVGFDGKVHDIEDPVEAVGEHPIAHTVKEIPEACQAKYTNVLDVGVAVKIISIFNMDLANGTFMADFNINVAWKGGGEDDGPAIQLYNIIEELEHERSPEAGAKKGSKGWDWFYRLRCRGCFRQQYSLHRFPFDVQNLCIDVRLKKQCRLVHMDWGPHGESCTFDSRAIQVGFSIADCQVLHRYLPSYKFGTLDGYDPETAIVLVMKRDPFYWVVNFGLVSSVVCALTVCCHGIPIANLGERLGVAFTLVLTMMAMKFLMQEKLPFVPYFTLLDIHVIICALLSMFLTAQMSLTHIIGVHRTEELEQWLVPVCGMFWFMYHGVILTMAYCGKLDG